MRNIVLMHSNPNSLLLLTVRFTIAGWKVYTSNSPQDSIRQLAKLHADGIKVQFLITEFNPKYIVQVNRLFNIKIIVVKSIDSNETIHLATPILPAIRSYVHKHMFKPFKDHLKKIAAINRLQNRKAELSAVKFKRINTFRIKIIGGK